MTSRKSSGRVTTRSQNVSKEDMDWLRSKSIDDVKGTNGTLKFDDIYW